jgi:hypothetical protein
MSELKKIRRALFISSAVVLALAAIAFWPTKRWAPPPRPALQAPIVFDELVSHPPPPSVPRAIPPSR